MLWRNRKRCANYNPRLSLRSFRFSKNENLFQTHKFVQSFFIFFCSKHVLDEAERSLHDALCVLTQTVKETRTVPGGGCTEIAMAAAIDAEVGI